jgi:hypothetical protein
VHKTLVGIATDYGLDGQGSVPDRDKRFSVIHSIQTGSGVHPASYTMGTGGSFLDGKEGHEADHPPLSSAKVKNGAIPPLQHTSSWSGA